MGDGRAPLRLTWSCALAAVLSLCCHVSALASSSLYDSQIHYLDDHGAMVELSMFKGKPAVVVMEYSECRYICSTQLLKLKEAQTLADQLGKPFEFIVISIDPENDTPATWTTYRQQRGLNRANWHFLTTDSNGTQRMAAQLGVHYWQMDGTIMHDFKLLRTDANGQVSKMVDHFDADLKQFLSD